MVINIKNREVLAGSILCNLYKLLIINKLNVNYDNFTIYY